MSSKQSKSQLVQAKESMYRQLLLDTAEAVFAEHGFDGAKMQSVASAASVSLSTLYGVFRRKDDLHSGVHARRLAELFDALNDVRVQSRGEPLLVRALAGTAAWIRFHMSHPNYLRMHLREGNAWTTLDSLRSDEQRDAWQRGFAQNARTNQLLMNEGWLRSDDPDVVTRMSVAMQQVRLAMWVEDGMTEDPDVVVEYLLELFLRSFAAHGREDEAVDIGVSGVREFELSVRGERDLILMGGNGG